MAERTPATQLASAKQRRKAGGRATIKGKRLSSWPPSARPPRKSP